MYFSVRDEWAFKGLFADPEEQDFQMVRLTLNLMYFHVSYPGGDDSCGSTILCGSIVDALNILQQVPRSSVLLQVPAFLNHKLGVPGLYRVAAIYQSTNHVAQPYIAETDDGRLFALQFDNDSASLNLATVEKKTHWRSPVGR